MEITTIIIIVLLALVALETTYLTYRAEKRPRRGRSDYIFVDTSVLMDGRILPIAETGFIPGTLVIPRSVVGELQFLADNADAEKRDRARKGLDMVKELQALPGITTMLLQDGIRPSNGVDERLLELAKKHGGKLCTIDYNLNKVAQVEEIAVLNVNELAKTLRMSVLPGERLSLALTTAGSESTQAVGHLSDGTMVVVEQAKAHIGKTVEVEVIRSLQTAAGRMMFARLVDQQSVSRGNNRQPRKKNTSEQQIVKRRKASPARKSAASEHQKVSKRQPRRAASAEDSLVRLANKSSD